MRTWNKEMTLEDLIAWYEKYVTKKEKHEQPQKEKNIDEVMKEVCQKQKEKRKMIDYDNQNGDNGETRKIMEDLIKEGNAFREKRKIDECMKVLKWTKGCIEKGLHDLQELLDDKEQSSCCWKKWKSYCEVIDLLKCPGMSNTYFIMAVGRLFYAMNMRGLDSDSVKVLLEELKPLVPDNFLWKEVVSKATKYYPALMWDEDFQDEVTYNEAHG